MLWTRCTIYWIKFTWLWVTVPILDFTNLTKIPSKKDTLQNSINVLPHPYLLLEKICIALNKAFFGFFFENPYRLYTVGCIDRILSNTKLVLFIHKTNISKRVLRQFPYQYEKVKIMYVSFLFKSYLLFCLYERWR